MRYVVDYPLVWLFTKLGFHGNGELGFDLETSLLLLGVLATYVALALRRAYGLGRMRAAVTGVALGFAIYVGLQLYRGLLFLVTFNTV